MLLWYNRRRQQIVLDISKHPNLDLASATIKKYCLSDDVFDISGMEYAQDLESIDAGQKKFVKKN